MLIETQNRAQITVELYGTLKNLKGSLNPTHVAEMHKYSIFYQSIYGHSYELYKKSGT